MPNTPVCTLFEGHYHFGLGALVNSLVNHGFKGVVWAGYRGQLPPWASPLRDKEQYRECRVTPGCVIRFVPVDIQYHFANYKPNFMVQILEELDPDARGVVYFDPDIVVKCSWSYLEEWLDFGIALCADVKSPLPENHPRRCAWRRFFGDHGIPLNFVTEHYVNSGFVGISRADKAFLTRWTLLLQLMAPEIGGLLCCGLETEPKAWEAGYHFNKTDQDALNSCIEAGNETVSIIGREGMDFAPGGYTMSHAVGGEKPWRKAFFRSALCGFPPTLADKGFLMHAGLPIRLYPAGSLKWKRLSLRSGAAVGRLIRRS